MCSGRRGRCLVLDRLVDILLSQEEVLTACCAIAVAVDCRSTAFGILQLKLDQRVQVLYGMDFARGVVRISHLSELALLALDDGHVVQLIYGDCSKRDYGHCSDDSTRH